VTVSVSGRREADRAALVLAPLSPGRSGERFSLELASSGIGGPSVDAAARALDRLEETGIDARLALPEVPALAVAPAPAVEEAHGLAGAWDAVADRLPEDWSDAFLEVELDSSDDVDRAALMLSPVNPFLHVDGIRPCFRFRAARRFGYGAAPSMVRRSLARLDEASVTGRLEVLRVQSDVRPVLTQGPVWREGGRAI